MIAFRSGRLTSFLITFTVGTQHVPRAICYGKLGADVATCTESFEAFFGASNATTSTGNTAALTYVIIKK